MVLGLRILAKGVRGGACAIGGAIKTVAGMAVGGAGNVLNLAKAAVSGDSKAQAEGNQAGAPLASQDEAMRRRVLLAALLVVSLTQAPQLLLPGVLGAAAAKAVLAASESKAKMAESGREADDDEEEVAVELKMAQSGCLGGVPAVKAGTGDAECEHGCVEGDSRKARASVSDKGPIQGDKQLVSLMRSVSDSAVGAREDVTGGGCNSSGVPTEQQGLFDDTQVREVMAEVEQGEKKQGDVPTEQQGLWDDSQVREVMAEVEQGEKKQGDVGSGAKEGEGSPGVEGFAALPEECVDLGLCFGESAATSTDDVLKVEEESGANSTFSGPLLATHHTSDDSETNSDASDEDSAAQPVLSSIASAKLEPASAKTCAARASRDEGSSGALSSASSCDAVKALLCSPSSSSSGAESTSSGSEPALHEAAAKEKTLLGAGTFGSVYVEGEDAVKVMMCHEPRVVRDAEFEFGCLRALACRNVVEARELSFEDLGEGEGKGMRALLRMERCEGSLEAYLLSLPRDTPVYVREGFALQVLKQAAQGLAVVHGAGLVHGDIKPANILLAKFPASPEDPLEEGTVKLADFGLAHYEADAHLLSQPVGTPLFMAPELWILGEPNAWRIPEYACPLGSKCDMYSLGKTLEAMLIWSEGEEARVKGELRVRCKLLLSHLLHEFGVLRPTAQELLRHTYLRGI